jgi:regulator of sirC expression with transglutaminase-like and TPR domain
MLDDELKRAQYDESIVLFSRQCERRPQRGDLRWFRGEARRLRGQGDDVDLARDDFTAALALEKAPAQAYRSLAFIHRLQGHKEAAAEAFARYLDAMPTAPDARMIESYLLELK